MVSLISFDVKQEKTKLYCCDKRLKQKKRGTCPPFKSYEKVANLAYVLQVLNQRTLYAGFT